MADKIKISEMTVATDAQVTATAAVAAVVGGDSKSATAEQILMVQSLTRTRWKDLKFPLTRDKQGNTQKPDYDYTNMGLKFPKDDATEIAYFITQMDHSYKQGTDLYPHIHFVQSDDVAYGWKIDYRWYDNNGDPTVAFATLALDTYQYVYATGDILQIAYSATAIDGSGITSLSSMLDIKLYRDDNLGAATVLGKEFDLHYESDSLGSASEWVK